MNNLPAKIVFGDGYFIENKLSLKDAENIIGGLSGNTSLRVQCRECGFYIGAASFNVYKTFAAELLRNGVCDDCMNDIRSRLITEISDMVESQHLKSLSLDSLERIAMAIRNVQ